MNKLPLIEHSGDGKSWAQLKKVGNKFLITISRASTEAEFSEKQVMFSDEAKAGEEFDKIKL